MVRLFGIMSGFENIFNTEGQKIASDRIRSNWAESGLKRKVEVDEAAGLDRLAVAFKGLETPFTDRVLCGALK